MKQLTHEINLNMTQPNNFEYVYAMQSDYDSEIVVATLYDGNTLYTIDANQAVLNGVTENGNTIVYNNVTIDSDKHRISFPLTKEMLFESGDTRFVVSFFDTRNNQRKSAFPFIIKSVSDAEGTLPVSVLKKISEYVAEAAASAKEAKESAKNAKDSATNAKTSELNAKNSENKAKKYATEAKSYAVGGTGTRENEDIQNTQYYYNIIKELFDQHLEQILYYTDYASFEKDYNAEKITPRTLVLIAEGGESDNGNATNPYCVNVTLANNMTRVETSGSLKQYIKGSKTIDEIIINANSGYYFPDDYKCVGTVNGIVISKNNENQLSISGSPTKNTEITLIAPSKQEEEKGEQSAPTGLSDGGGKINGTTTAMEYSSDHITWKNCSSGNTTVEAGIYYVRYKETDKLKASPSTTVEVSENEVAIPEAVTDLKVIYNEYNTPVITCTIPKGASYVNLYNPYSVDEKENDLPTQTPFTTLTSSNNTYILSASNITLDSYHLNYFYAYAFNDKNEFSKRSNIIDVFSTNTRIENNEYERIYLFKEGDTCNDITNGWVCDTPSLGGVASKYMYINTSTPGQICLHTQTGLRNATGAWQTDQENWIRKYCQKLHNAILCVEYSIVRNGNFIGRDVDKTDDKNYISMGMYTCYNGTTEFKKPFGYSFSDVYSIEEDNRQKFTTIVMTSFDSYLVTASGTDFAVVCNIADSTASADVQIHNIFISYKKTTS